MRLLLWQNGFSPRAQLAADLNLAHLAEQHALSGGAIMNVIRYASLQAIKNDQVTISADDIRQGIRQEYAKEGSLG